MKTKEYICVLCPRGCVVVVSYEPRDHSNSKLNIKKITGHGCERGREWAVQEVLEPRRSFVGSVSVRKGDCPTVSVKTSRSVPLEDLKKIGLHTHRITVDAPVHMHQVIEKNILGLEEVDLIATREVGPR